MKWGGEVESVRGGANISLLWGGGGGRGLLCTISLNEEGFLKEFLSSMRGVADN